MLTITELLCKEINENLIKQRIKPCSRVARFNMIKKSVLPKLIYR